jgi:hypothetical protein
MCCRPLLEVSILGAAGDGFALPSLADQRRSQMAFISNASGPGQSPWIGIVKILLLVILVALIFLLGQEMVRHRFFRGGWIDQRDVLKP